MKKIKDLVVPLGDAENYRTRDDKAFFNDVYFRTDYLEALLEPHKYFLCGDKGTGKTAMAVYLHNNDYKNTLADHVFIRDTEIQTLNNLRRANRLSLPDSQLLWETAILLRVARVIDASVLDNGWIERYALLRSIKATLEKYYEDRQNPEIKVDIEILRNRDLAAQLAGDALGLNADVKVGSTQSEKTAFNHFRDLLYAVNGALKKAIAKGKYKKRIIIFLDGLDNRQEETNPSSYAETLGALGRAVWHLNADFFSGIRDTSYRPKIVLLMRPEIIELIGLSNTALKMRDNAVELNWVVNDESNYENSRLFQLIGHILQVQQPSMAVEPRDVWNHYFPYKVDGLSSFLAFLRRSYHRPRDLVTRISQMRDHARGETSFNVDDFRASEVERKFSEYLLSEIRNGLEYRMSREERDLIPLFFKSFKGRRKLTYVEYVAAHSNFVGDCKRRGKKVIETAYENCDELLQILFENNILAYIERTEGDRSYVRWYFRERTIGDPRPEVQFDEIYVVHDGLAKALDLGVAKKTGRVESKERSRRRTKRH